MARRSLRPHLNQIRTWVRQGRTDAWIAHQLEVTVQQIEAFKRENELSPAAEDAENGAPPADFDDEIDLRAEDDALIAAELEAAEARRREEEEEQRRREEEEAAAKAAEASARAEAGEGDGEGDEEDEDGDAAPRRRRGRRGGRGRRRTAVSAASFEGTFDHGEEGYGLWLDPAVADTPVYAEHWAGHRPVEVTVEEDQIVIRRAGGDDEDADEE
jgi:DNA-binding protein H-NS